MKKISLLVLLVPFFTFGQWTQLANDIDGEAVNDQSGTSVDLSADGNIIAIGAPFNDNSGNVAGNVRIFENQAGTWTQIGANINGSATLDRSGFSVSLSDDGNIIAIGAPDKTSGGFESGQVRIFENQSGNWTQIGDEIIGEAFSDHSGFSVALSGDGMTVAIGAPDNEGSMGGNFGHVRVYSNQSGDWDQIGDDIDGEAAEDNSGFSVAINEDGTIVAIGAPFNDGIDSDAGHVRVYQNQSEVWVQLGDDIDGEAANDRFGTSVELSADGTIVAIGARDNNSTGHVRVLQFQSGNWIQIGDDIDGEAINERFGSSLDLSANGTILAVGAPFNGAAGSETGRVKIYQNQSGSWTQIDNSIDGEAMEDRSGSSVSLSADGSIVAIGAPLNDDNGGNSGHARTYNNLNILNVQENGLQQSFVLYPNPTSTRITLNLGSTYTAIDAGIYDATGKQLMTQNYSNTDTIAISTENFTNGVYFLKIQDSEDTQTVLKIIKE